MSQDLKKLLGEVIEMHRAELCKMADLIYDFAEKSAEEYKSMELLTDYLQNEGFTVERGGSRTEGRGALCDKRA